MGWNRIMPRYGTGQQSPRGVTRPPLVTTQQETPPPVNAVRSESAGARSLGDQLRAQVRAAQQQMAELMAANRELWDGIRTRDRRIVGLEEDKRRLGEGNAELTIRNEGLRVVIRRQQAQIDAASRMPGDDREPTEPLPGWPPFDRGLGAHAVRDEKSLARNAELMDQEAALSGPWPDDDGDLYMPGWQGRSSAQSSAPRVGE